MGAKSSVHAWDTRFFIPLWILFWIQLWCIQLPTPLFIQDRVTERESCFAGTPCFRIGVSVSGPVRKLSLSNIMLIHILTCDTALYYQSLHCGNDLISTASLLPWVYCVILRNTVVFYCLFYWYLFVSLLCTLYYWRNTISLPCSVLHMERNSPLTFEDDQLLSIFLLTELISNWFKPLSDPNILRHIRKVKMPNNWACKWVASLTFKLLRFKVFSLHFFPLPLRCRTAWSILWYSLGRTAAGSTLSSVTSCRCWWLSVSTASYLTVTWWTPSSRCSQSCQTLTCGLSDTPARWQVRNRKHTNMHTYINTSGGRSR